jgi:transcriptional regulator GlxA family with amidase domain
MSFHVAIVTLQGFNELDSLIAYNLLKRIKRVDLRVTLCCPEAEVTSMNGVIVRAQSSLEDAATAQAVMIGSGVRTRELIASRQLLSRMKLHPEKQLIAAQCSGVLLLSSLGLLSGLPVCTDLATRSSLQEAGVEVLEQPFFATGNMATAGGCLASLYLAAWIMARVEGLDAALAAIGCIAPVGEKEDFVAKTVLNISPYLPENTPLGAVTKVPRT